MIVNVTFPVHMYVKVDTETGEMISTIVQTPNVASMANLLPDLLDVQTEDFRTVCDAEVRDEAILLLDDNEWPAPTLVA